MATPAQVSETSLWLDQYSAGSTRLEAGTVAAVLAAYSEVQDWYDPAETVAAATNALLASRAGQQCVAGLASEFIRSIVSIFTGKPTTASRIQVPYPRAANEFDVYSRPIWTYRDTIARGGTESDAFIAARLRAELITTMDSILAERDAAIAEVETQTVTALRYRRVIRPELSASGTCGLCIAVSTQVYSTKKLMPLHERCQCKVMPIMGSDDVGLVINKDDLEQYYGDAGGNTAALLKRTRYKVDEHGELGPVLLPEGDRNPSDKPEPDSRSRAEAELSKLLPTLSALEAREQAGEDVSGPLTYQRERIAKLRRVLSNFA